MNKAKIEWTDRSWNPVTGCRHGCRFCYARRWAQRLGYGFAPKFWPERLAQPARTRKPKRISVSSMGELFGEWVPRQWVEKVLTVVRECGHHTFQFLTKNPERLSEFNPWPGNAWVGASAADQKMADKAIARLADVDASVRFVSCEPLLDSIGLTCGDFLDWIIIGACTGPMASEPKASWVNDLTTDARSIGAAVFYKPNLTWPNPPREFPRPRKCRLRGENMRQGVLSI